LPFGVVACSLVLARTPNLATTKNYILFDNLLSKMAGNAEKKQATKNTKILKEIHLISLGVNALTLLIIFLLNRPSNKKPFFFFNVPLVICELIVEKIGRPRFTLEKVSGGRTVPKLVSSGEDLSQSGLTEYLFDIIYFTLLQNIVLVILGTNNVWYLSLVIPAFAAYKLYGLFLGGRQLLGGRSSFKEEEPASGSKEKGQSKRQQKLEKRGQKVRYR